MAKEGLFNVLNNKIDFEDVRVLDLFAGTGNISLEFASRGAIEVVAVERNRTCVNFMKKMTKELGFANMLVVKTDVFRFVRYCSTRYDIIFADPPYDLTNIAAIPDMVFNEELLEPGGLFILEHPGKVKFESHEAFLERRKYGQVHFSFFGYDLIQESQ